MTDQTPIRTRSRFLREEELEARPPFQWLIKDVLPETGIALLFSKPGEGKSFLAIALAEAIAHGVEGWGTKFEAGQVLYIAAEGDRGLGKRLKGWRIHNGVAAGRNLIVCPEAVQFGDDKAASEFSKDLRDEIIGPTPLRLVVIDTLSRCLGKGDENSQATMGAFIGNIQKEIVDRFNCLALILHHTPRANSETPRGSNVNDGAADTMLLVGKQGDGQLVTVVKQKDGEDGHSMLFERKEIELTSGNDETETTLVMSLKERRAGPLQVKRPSKRDLALQVLAAAGRPLTREEWREAFKKAGGEPPGRGGRTFNEAFNSLDEEGLLACGTNATSATYSPI